MVTKKVGFIIQARMGSERLAGKVLMPLPYDSSHTILSQIITRAQAVNENCVVALATTINPMDDAIEDYFGQKLLVYRGDEENVLSRYYQLGYELGLDHVVRLTGDNPFIDVEYTRLAISSHLTSRADYTCTSGLPLGTNIEVISFGAIEDVCARANSAVDKEHVTSYIRRNASNYRVNFHDLSMPDLSTCRLTVDTPSDYALACLLYEKLFERNPYFGIEAIDSLFKKSPWMADINRDTIQKSMYSDAAVEFTEAIQLLEKYNMDRVIKLLNREA